MTNKKGIAILSVIAIVVLFWAGCEMSVSESVIRAPIFEPYISTQPQSYAFPVAGYTNPTLTVEVAEWNNKDGALSYQWYTFSTLKDYYIGNLTEIENATNTSFTPNITAEAGKTFYFLVKITNTNGNALGDQKSASITSDVATISFNTDGQPAIPVITQNPVSASYTMGRTPAVASLDVRASAAAPSTGSNTLLYQWYSFSLPGDLTGNLTTYFNTDGTPIGTEIPGATARAYLPEIPALRMGKNYYYVTVTNVTSNPSGDETGKTSAVSVPAIITMKPGEKALEPRIVQEPKELLYFTGDDPAAKDYALTVYAVSVDNGALTYQWYSCTATGTNPQLITGATTASWKPTVATSAETTAYYYVNVTNTVDAEAVEEGADITAVTRSKIVRVRVQANTVPSANATITVDTNTKYQYIRGFGGMETTWGNFYQSDVNDMKNMFEVLGYNIWRIMIPPVSTKMEGEGGMEEYLMQRDYTNRYYENVKFVNAHNGYVLASPWSPPKEWKSNNSINSGGNLIPKYYNQYANYLRSYARHMASRGAPVYAVSIANEPNYAGGYDGCEWTPEEMRNFYKEVGRFTQGVRGFGGGKVIPTVLTVNGESANNPNINEAAMSDPVSNAAIDMFARHVYGAQTKRLWGNGNLNGRDVWMTEHNINSATETAFPNDWKWNYIWRFMNDVDLVIRLNNENAFVWWAAKRFYSFIGDGAAGTSKGTILPRGWGMAHYSKYTIDTTRVKVSVTGNIQNSSGSSVTVSFNATDLASTSDSSNVNNTVFDLDNPSARVTAFVSGDGKEISLVMWTPTLTDGSGGYNFGTVRINAPGNAVIRSAIAMRSRSELGGPSMSGVISNMGIEENVNLATDRTAAFISLPRSEIVSVKIILE